MNYTDLLRTIFEVVLGLGVIFISFPYLRSRYSKGKTEAQTESNSILRGLVDDQDKKINNLVAGLAEATQKIAYLTGRVDELAKKKADLEVIISDALTHYFEAHPDKAGELYISMKSAETSSQG